MVPRGAAVGVDRTLFWPPLARASPTCESAKHGDVNLAWPRVVATTRSLVAPGGPDARSANESLLTEQLQCVRHG